MNAAITQKLPVIGDQRRDVFDLRDAIPVFILLLASISLYIWMAPRGFDFTDESFYVLNYIHWRYIFGIVTFFGAYFELPFRLLGQNLPAMRVFGLFLLLAGSAFFSHELFSYVARRDGRKYHVPLIFILVGMSSSMLYFGFRGSLRAPAYDILVLFSMLTSTSILLRLLERGEQKKNSFYNLFFYGITLGICCLTKATSGLLLVICHLLFFLLVNHDWRRSYLFQVAAFSLAGVGVNFVVLQWVHPGWLGVLIEGVQITTAGGGYTAMTLFNQFRWHIQAIMPIFLLLAMCATLIFMLLKRWSLLKYRLVLYSFVVILSCVCAFFMACKDLDTFRIPLLGIAVLLLWRIECEINGYIGLPNAKSIGLVVLMFALPYMYSFGTNTGVLKHSQMATVFPMLILMLRLYRFGSIVPKYILVACLTIISFPSLVTQLGVAQDIRYTYRQLSALGEHTYPIRIGPVGNTLSLDVITYEDLSSLISKAKIAGLQPHQEIIDFTGFGPGLIYALAGRPVGTAWLINDFSNSKKSATHLINKMSIESLKYAWILSSDGDPRGTDGWRDLMGKRVGNDTHQRVAKVPIRLQAPNVTHHLEESVLIEIWKPSI